MFFVKEFRSILQASTSCPNCLDAMVTDTVKNTETDSFPALLFIWPLHSLLIHMHLPADGLDSSSKEFKIWGKKNPKQTSLIKAPILHSIKTEMQGSLPVHALDLSSYHLLVL